MYRCRISILIIKSSYDLSMTSLLPLWTVLPTWLLTWNGDNLNFWSLGYVDITNVQNKCQDFLSYEKSPAKSIFYIKPLQRLIVFKIRSIVNPWNLCQTHNWWYIIFSCQWKLLESISKTNKNKKCLSGHSHDMFNPECLDEFLNFMLLTCSPYAC